MVMGGSKWPVVRVDGLLSYVRLLSGLFAETNESNAAISTTQLCKSDLTAFGPQPKLAGCRLSFSLRRQSSVVDQAGKGARGVNDGCKP